MRWLVCLLYMSIISLFLLTRQAGETAATLIASEELRFIATKGFHLLAFTFLAVLGGWLRVPMFSRPLWLLVFSLYACGTEYLQQWVPTRHGCWQDAALNHLGLFFGLLLSWRWWTAPTRPGGSVPLPDRSA